MCLAASKLPPLMIGESSIRTTLAYVDHALSDEVFRLTLALAVDSRNISTYELPGGKWGTFEIRGHLAENPRSFVINLQGKLAPLLDPEQPSFDLSGDIADVDLSRMQAVVKEIGLSSESVALNVSVRCRDGQFDRKMSSIAVRFKNARPEGKLAKRLKGMPLKADLSVVVPISGTVKKTRFHWEEALLRSLLENTASILQGIPEDNAVLDKNSTKLLKELGQALEKK